MEQFRDQTPKAGIHLAEYLKHLPAAALLATACLGFLASSNTESWAVAGVDSNGTPVAEIGTAHINFGAQFGNMVGLVSLPGGTGTGTFVPSTVPGQLKFLTAAHNIDRNNDGILDDPNFNIFFGAAPGVDPNTILPDGTNATYRVAATAAQVAINPALPPGGQATNDLTVLLSTLMTSPR